MHANFLIWGEGHSRPYQRKSTLCAGYWSRVPLLETAKRHNQVAKWVQRPYLEKKSKKMEHSWLSWRVSLILYVSSWQNPPLRRESGSRLRVIRDGFLHFLISSLFPQQCFSPRFPRLSYYSHYPPQLVSLQVIATLVAVVIQATLLQHARSKQISP